MKLSEASLSQIVTGKAKPRQINLTKIMQAICETKAKEKELLAAYYVKESNLLDSTDALESPSKEDNKNRVQRYLEMKIASVRLGQYFEAVLLQYGIHYIRDFIKNNVICDFYLPENHLILEYKGNPGLDWHSTVITCNLLQKAFTNFAVILIVKGSESFTYHPEFRTIDLEVQPTALSNLIQGKRVDTPK